MSIFNRPLSVRDGGPQILHISSNPAGTRVVNTRLDGSIRIWRMAPQGPVSVSIISKPHAGPVKRVSWHPFSESVLASVGEDEYLKIWKLGGTTEREVKLAPEGEKLQICEYSPVGDCVAVSYLNRLIFFDNNDSEKESIEAVLDDIVCDIQWSVNGEFCLAGLANGTIAFVKLVAGGSEVVYQLKGPSLAITSIALDPRGEFICGGCDNGNVYFWRSSDLQNYQTLIGVDMAVDMIAIDRVNLYVAVGYSKSIKVYDYNTLRELHQFDNISSQQAAFAWIPKGNACLYGEDRRMMFAKLK